MRRHAERCERAINRAIDNLRREAKSIPTPEDRALTEDVAAVAAAVMGAFSPHPIAPAAPDYSRMSNDEYRQSVRDDYGFDPGV
jgi:hypothetical protein